MVACQPHKLEVGGSIPSSDYSRVHGIINGTRAASPLLIEHPECTAMTPCEAVQFSPL